MSDAPSPALPPPLPIHGPPQHYLGGIALRLLAMISLSLMFVLVKKIDAADIHIVESLFWRQALVLPFLLAWVMATRDRKRTRLNSSHSCAYRMPSSA